MNNVDMNIVEIINNVPTISDYYCVAGSLPTLDRI